MDPFADIRGLAGALLAAGHDPRAWAAVATVCRARLLGPCRAILGDHDLAEDALQDCLLRVRTCAHSFSDRNAHGDAAALAWLRCVAVNSALSLRRQRLPPDGERLEEAAGGEDPALRLARREAVELVDRELAAMPPALAEPVTLHDRRGIDYPDLAARYGWTVGTARVRVHRGRAELRRRLARLGLGAALLVLALPAAAAESPVAGRGPGRRRLAVALAGAVSVAALALANPTTVEDGWRDGPPAPPGAPPSAVRPPAPVPGLPPPQTASAFLEWDSAAGRAWLVRDGRWWPLRTLPGHLIPGTIGSSIDAATAMEAERWIDHAEVARDSDHPVLGILAAVHGRDLFGNPGAAGTPESALRLKTEGRSVQISITWGPGGRPTGVSFAVVRAGRTIAIIAADSLRESSVWRSEPGETWGQDADAVLLAPGALPLPGDEIRAEPPSPPSASS